MGRAFLDHVHFAPVGFSFWPSVLLPVDLSSSVGFTRAGKLQSTAR